LWDEAFVDSDGVLKWCSRPEVAVPVKPEAARVDISREPFLLVSSPGLFQPFLRAVSLESEEKTDALCQIPEHFFVKNNC